MKSKNKKQQQATVIITIVLFIVSIYNLGFRSENPLDFSKHLFDYIIIIYAIYFYMKMREKKRNT